MSVIKQRALFNAEYLKEYSLLPTNFNLDEVWNFVPLTELLHIIPIIGNELYKELLDLVELNNVTPANATLLLEIYPFEGLALMEVAMPYISYHITEVGITIGRSENSEGASVKDVNYLTDYIKSLMIPLKQKLRDFLNANKELYPLYKSEPVAPSNTWNVYGFNPVNTDIDGNRLKI